MYDDVVTALTADGVSFFSWGWLVVVGQLYVVLPHSRSFDPLWCEGDVSAILRYVRTISGEVENGCIS